MIIGPLVELNSPRAARGAHANLLSSTGTPMNACTYYISQMCVNIISKEVLRILKWVLSFSADSDSDVSKIVGWFFLRLTLVTDTSTVNSNAFLFGCAMTDRVWYYMMMYL